MRLEAYMPDKPLPSETREAPTPMKTIGNGLMLDRGKYRWREPGAGRGYHDRGGVWIGF